MNLENIPKEIQNLKQWVCSRLDSKVPMRATSPYPASSTNPDTWSTFQEAVMSVDCGNYNYVGFVFNGNGIVGIDIDAGYDDDGFLTDIASDIIGRCKSYTENSRSGRGVHILLKGTLPFKGKNNRAGVEIYQEARYFIMTGDTVIYDKIIENQEAIDYIADKYFAMPLKESGLELRPTESRIYLPEWMRPTDRKIILRPNYPRIPDGSRNICLTSLAGALHNQGYSRKQIYDELIYCNKTACDPSLCDREIQSIVNSVTRYKR